MVSYNMIMLGEASIPIMGISFLLMMVVTRYWNNNTDAFPSRVKVNVLDICKIFVGFGSKFG